MISLFLLAVLMPLPTSGQAAAPTRGKLESLAWTSENSAVLKQSIGDSQSATVFVRRFFPDSDPGPEVGECAFVKLDNTEKLSLVCDLDWSGRAFYTMILIVRKKNGRFVTQEIETGRGASISRLRDSIVDLRGKGEKQILVPRLLGPYAGALPAPEISDVYRWNGERFEKADHQFKDYYSNKVLPQLESELMKLKGTTTTEQKTMSKLLVKNLEIEISEVKKILND